MLFYEMNRNEPAELQTVFCFMHPSSDDHTDLDLVLLNIVYTYVHLSVQALESTASVLALPWALTWHQSGPLSF